MKLNLRYILPLFLFALAACNNKKEMNNSKNDNALVFPKGEKITNDNFTGTAYLQMPGARSNWHSHPAGQILVITNGIGYHQMEGKPVEMIKKGDVVKCPPSVKHWHGASADTAFVQVAVTNNDKGATVWMDAVTDNVYNSSNQ